MHYFNLKEKDQDCVVDKLQVNPYMAGGLHINTLFLENSLAI